VDIVEDIEVDGDPVPDPVGDRETNRVKRVKKKMVGKVLVLLFCAVLSALCSEDSVNLQELLQFDEDSIMDLASMKTVKVPCDFCNVSLLVLLELCKQTNGYSIPEVNDFLIRCTEIGGLRALPSLTTNCSETEIEQQRVNYIYERRLRCAKIFRGLVKLYDPYDPCVQMHADYQRNPMAICKASEIDCQPPSNPVTPPHLKPPYTSNLTIEYQPPPLTCANYVNSIVEKCHELKQQNYYVRTNLLDWCNSTFNGTYERLGCSLVAGLMSKRDSRMDLCSGLKIFPIDPSDNLFCDNYLGLPANSSVPLPEYDKYYKYVQGVDKDNEYQRVQDIHPPLARGQRILLPH